MSQNRNNNCISLFQNTQVEEDFQIELSDNSVSFIQGIARMNKAVVCVCLKGSMTIEVDIKEYVIQRNTYLTLFPGQIVNLKMVSEDFEAMYFAVSAQTFSDMLFRFPPEFTIFLKKNGIYQELSENIEIEKRRYEKLKAIYDDKDNMCRREILLNLIRVFYLELYNEVYKLWRNIPIKNDRRIELFGQFVKSVMEDYKVNREVLFYANKLNISAKYLSKIVLEQNGKNAKKWIDEYVASEIKIRLRSSNESLQDMAYELNFADQSFLSKFFKRQTGISPSEYRKTIV